MDNPLNLSAVALANFLNAFKHGALFKQLGDRIYAYQLDTPGNYVCWCVEPGSQEYTTNVTSCSCPSFTRAKRECKHMQGLRELLAVPAPKRRRPSDRRRTRG